MKWQQREREDYEYRLSELRKKRDGGERWSWMLWWEEVKAKGGREVPDERREEAQAKWRTRRRVEARSLREWLRKGIRPVLRPFQERRQDRGQEAPGLL